MPAYTYEERMKAVRLYIQYDSSPSAVIHELGYPSRNMLTAWYREYMAAGKLPGKNNLRKSKYTEEQRKTAVAYYLEHGRSISHTIKALGYPKQTALSDWLNADLPGDKRKWHCKASGSVVKCTAEQKEQAVKDYCTGKSTPTEIAGAYGINPNTVYTWKRKLLGQETRNQMPRGKDIKTTDTAVSDVESLIELRSEKEVLAKQVQALEKDIYRLQLERDILEKAGEILKKDRGICLKTLTNREKAVLIDSLRHKYRLKILIDMLNIAKSSYCYQERVLNTPDKYTDLRTKVKNTFLQNYSAYGYRRIHKEIQKSEIFVSEKVIRKIMREEHLVVFIVKKKKYSSYQGEIPPAVANIVNRNFHSEISNAKWLTDITEFHIPAGKIYLSPMIDCFDGMAVSWSISTSPDADLVNSMLDDAISILKENEHPIVHSDRGCHYRWPGWIERMTNAGLIRSMSKKGCSPDNSACEGFFGRLKNEMFYGRSWAGVTIEQFIETLNSYMKWYNEKRIKISLGAISPIDYRRRLGLAA